MAIFQDESELKRQDQRVPFEAMRGLKKGVASVLGYDARGGRNKWGKALNVITPYAETVAAGMGAPGLVTGLSIGGRAASKELAKGTDAGLVMEETDDEFLEKSIQDVSSAITMYGSATNLSEAAGGTGALGAAGGAATGGSGMDSVVGGSAGSELADMQSASKLANTQDSINADIDDIDIDELTAADFDEALAEEDELEDVSNLVDSVSSKNKKEEAKNKSVSDKATKDLTNMLGEGGKIIEAGTKSYALNKEYADASEEEALKLLQRKRKTTKNYL